MIVLIVIVAVICLSYVSMVIYWLAGWYKIPEIRHNSRECKHTFSIVVAFYNEQTYIERCLESLVNVDYDKQKYEIILVNDGSTDHSIEIVKRIVSAYPQADITILNREHTGKKQAIQEGVQAAKYELILTTDADCAVMPAWIATYDAYYEKYAKCMMFGSVAFFSQPRLFNRLQQLEMGSLMVAASGSVGQEKVLMCSAANMCYTKNMYISVQSALDKSNKYISGDDVFLLHACAENYGATSIGYVRSSQALVYTQAQKSFRSFLRQRIRWAGKAPHYENRYAKYVALNVASMSILLISLLLLACVNMVGMKFALSVLVVKFLIDMPVLFIWCNYIGKRTLMYLYPLAAICYPWYILAVLAGMCGKNRWWK